MKKIAVHPGEYLRSEYLEPLQLPVSRLADMMGVSKSSLSRLIAGKADLSAQMAVRLGRVLGTPALLWLNLQTAFDLERAMAEVDQATVIPYFYGIAGSNKKKNARTGR
jgi:addiction module HigA family antidote